MIKRTNSIYFKLLLSHISIAIISVIFLFFAVLSLAFVSTKTQELISYNSPSVVLSNILDDAVHKTNSALYGWITMDNERFKDERHYEWSANIKPSIKKLLALNENNPAIKKKLIKLDHYISEMEDWQWFVEDIAQSPGNLPAEHFLNTYISPIYEIIKYNIHAVIQVQKYQAKNFETDMFFLWEDGFENNLSRSFLALQKYIEHNTLGDQIIFDQSLKQATNYIQKIKQNQSNLLDEQKDALKVILYDFESYKDLSQKVIEEAKKETSNYAKYYLVNELYPLARLISKQLTLFSINETQKMLETSQKISVISKIIPTIMMFLMIVLIISAFIFARYQTLKIYNPIFNLVKGTKKLAKAKLFNDIPITSNDEIGELTKSFNHMRKRLAHARNELENSKQKIQIAHDHLVQEQQVAKRIFDSILDTSILHEPIFKYKITPSSIFSGDLFVAERLPTGNLQILTGDFTSHGLPAAIGVLPTCDIFYAMTRKNLSIETIVKEINEKLTKILPVGIFCASCFVKVDYKTKKLSYWNGGLPAPVIIDKHCRIKQVLKSKHMPLGILSNASIDNTIDLISFNASDRLIMFTDGIIEAKNVAGEFYGEERLYNTIQECKNPDDVFDHILNTLRTYCGDERYTDDVTLAEIKFS